MKVMSFRVKFVLDESASFEECNGERRPLTRTEYRQNAYRGCPDHPRGFKGSKAKDTNDNGRGRCACGKPYADIPYTEYLAYYGNPDRHVYVGCIVEGQCACCSTWNPVSSLWNIDTMDDDPAYLALHLDRYYTADDAATLPDYLGDVARDLLVSAKEIGQ